MEVHQHTHTPRRKWTHYFWEFLMLFLAVFCGFLAEYKLEHTIEKNREKQYIKSFAEDLAADVKDLDDKISYSTLTINSADTLISLLLSPDREKWASDIYYFFRFIHRSPPFSVNDRTIVQLRNAGGMRLVSNKDVSDSMVSYYKAVEFIKWLYEEQVELKRSLRPNYGHLLNGKDFAKVIDSNNRVVRTNEILKLRPASVDVTNAFIITLQNIKGINQGIRMRLQQLQKNAIASRDFIRKEYNLD